jgi:hypothetical protein
LAWLAIQKSSGWQYLQKLPTWYAPESGPGWCSQPKIQSQLGRQKKKNTAQAGGKLTAHSAASVSFGATSASLNAGAVG